jgi:hypothetical protein
MSNFRHWATDSLREKLQTLPIFVFILYQMDKPSGICIVSPNTKALALHSRVVLALKSLILISFYFVVGLNVFVWFWIFGCILFTNARVRFLRFLCKVEIRHGFVFRARVCKRTLISSLFIYNEYYSIGPALGYV